MACLLPGHDREVTSGRVAADILSEYVLLEASVMTKAVSSGCRTQALQWNHRHSNGKASGMQSSRYR